MNEIGVMLNNLEPDRLKAFGVAASHGFRVVHTNAIREEFFRPPLRQQYMDAAKASGVEIAAMFIGFEGQDYSNFKTIRETVGLAVPHHREHRKEIAKEYSRLAHDIGVSTLAGHMGFMPKSDDPDYSRLVTVMREILDVFADRGQRFLFETGQESADELLAFMAAVERTNIAVNFDPGNFVLYGADEPLSAFDKLSPQIEGVHCKDGLPPTNDGELGTEKPLGDGSVDFTELLQRVKKIGYNGPLIIERETGDDRVGEILRAREYLNRTAT